MTNSTEHPSEFDSLAACASATLALAIGAARKLSGEHVVVAWAKELERLPKWLADPAEWLRQLRKFTQAGASEETDVKSTEAIMFMRVCNHAAMAADARYSLPSRHRALTFAGLSCGILYRGSNVEAEFAYQLSKQNSVASKQRVKVKGMDEAKALFDEWYGNRGKLTTYTKFAEWACAECGLDSVQHLARKAGEWGRSRKANTRNL